jgi:hypothetical protein
LHKRSSRISSNYELGHHCSDNHSSLGRSRRSLGWLSQPQGNGAQEAKGIGWQFIRFTVIAIAVPVAGLLALNKALSPEAATIIAGALGYAFGQSEKSS